MKRVLKFYRDEFGKSKVQMLFTYLSLNLGLTGSVYMPNSISTIVLD